MPETTTEVTTEVATEVTMEVKLLPVLKGEMSKKDLMRALHLKNEEHFRKSYLQPALKNGLIEMTIPDKPKSRNQRYRLTEKGKKILEEKATGV